MNKPFPVALALLLLAGCSPAAQAPSVEVKQAWLRLPAAPGGAAAGYFVAEARHADDALISASLPGARIEMHESMTMNHMASMRPIDSAAFDGKTLVFQPGGKHLMVFGLGGDAKAGGTLPLTLRFRTAPAVTVQAKLVAAGQPAPGDDG